MLPRIGHPPKVLDSPLVDVCNGCGISSFPEAVQKCLPISAGCLAKSLCFFFCGKQRNIFIRHPLSGAQAGQIGVEKRFGFFVMFPFQIDFGEFQHVLPLVCALSLHEPR